MTAETFASKAGFSVICMPEPDKEVNGAYIGDLLSWVMGRASSSNIWITIMSNINIVAVATLSDVSCILLAEGVTLGEDVTELALSKGINILSSPLSAYECAVKISGII